jgi:hypothetical protein
MIELIRKQPIFCLFALFLLLLTVILLLKLGKFLLFSKGRLRRRSLSQSSRDLTRPSPAAAWLAGQARSPKTLEKPRRCTHFRGFFFDISTPWYARLSGAGVPRQHSTLRMRKPRRARLPPGLLFWPLAAANFFSIILEPLSGGRVCSLGETPPGPTPKTPRWKPRAPNRGFRFIPPHLSTSETPAHGASSFDPPLPLGLAQKPTDGPNVFWACSTLSVHALCRPRGSLGALRGRCFQVMPRFAQRNVGLLTP